MPKAIVPPELRVELMKLAVQIGEKYPADSASARTATIAEVFESLHTAVSNTGHDVESPRSSRVG
jgi:hypothetical protein